MFFEFRRVYLYRCCLVCGGKIFRYALEGTYQSDEYGTTFGLMVRDRCEDCREVFAETGTALKTPELLAEICDFFAQWERRVLAQDDFVAGIRNLFKDVGGFIDCPRQNAS